MTAAALAIATLLAVATPQNTPSQAVALSEAGYQAFVEGRFDDAATAFDEAYELDPHLMLLWNAARAHDGAGHIAQALVRFDRLLFLLQDLDPVTVGLSPEDVAHAKRRLEVLARAVAEPVPKSPDTRPAPQDPEPQPPDPDPSVHEPAPEPPASNIGPWVTLGVSGGVALVGVALWAAAHIEAANPPTVHASHGGVGVVSWQAQTQAEAFELESRIQHLNIAAGVAVGLGAAGLTAGLIWALMEPGPDSRQATWTPTATFHPEGGASVGFSGRF